MCSEAVGYFLFKRHGIKFFCLFYLFSGGKVCAIKILSYIRINKNKNIMIKVIIKVETDCDFKLGFPKFIKGLRKIKYDSKYFIKLELEEDTAKTDIIEFLREIEIDSSKEWHKEQFKSGIAAYEQQLKNVLCGSLDFFGGGNWSFQVEVYRVTEEYL